MRRLLASLAAAVVLLGAGGFAAAAHDGPVIDVVTFPSGTEDKPIDRNDPKVIGTVRMPKADDRIKAVHARVVRCADKCGGEAVLDETLPGNNGSSQSATFSPLQLRYNGKYRATVTATWVHMDGLGPLRSETDRESGAKELVFYVAAPPVPPQGVRASATPEGRAVTLTWKPNPEPDLLFYVVQRRRAGEQTFVIRGEPTEETTFTDTFAPADPGGDYEYNVVAVRQGVTKDSGVNSDTSPVAAVKVADPPADTPTTTAAGGSGTTVATGTRTTSATSGAKAPGALTTSGSIDLSGFNTLKSRSRPPAPRSIQPPDTGYQDTLPFTARPGESEMGEEDGGAEIGDVGGESAQRELGLQETSDQRQRSMAFMAAGLLATVLAMHLLWVRSEVKREPLEAMVPEDRGSSRPRSPVG